MSINKNLIYVSSVGGSLEFFDFMIFIHLYPIIIEKFFPPSSNDSQKIFLTIMTVIISYAAKPFGGIFYGIVGEKFGVIRSFNSTLLIISASTLCITFLPTYNEIGVFSTILLILFRIFQGFSNGGEIPSSVIYVYENAIEKEKSLSNLFFAFTIGSCIASYCALLITSFKEILGENIYFRIPFFIGGIFSIIAYFIRKKYTVRNSIYQINKTNLKLIYKFSNLKTHFKFIIIYGFGSTLMANYFIIIPNIYFNKYYSESFKVKIIISFSLLIIAIFSIFNGFLLRKFNFKKVYFIGVLLNVIYSPFYFYFVTSKNEYLFIIGQIIAGIICAPIFGNIYSLVCNEFRKNMLLNFSIVSNFAVTVFPPLTSSLIIYLISFKLSLPSLLVSSYGILILIILFRQKKQLLQKERILNDVLNRSI